MRDFWLAGTANILPSKRPSPSPASQLVGMRNIFQCVFILEVSSFPLHMLHTQGAEDRGWWDPQRASIMMGGDLLAVLGRGLCVSQITDKEAEAWRVHVTGQRSFNQEPEDRIKA